MGQHTPQGMANNATGNQSNDGNFPPPYIFEDGATVNFKVHAIKDATKEMKFMKGDLVLTDCEVWEFQIILKDNQGNSNFVYHNVVKDGRAWNVLDKNGNPWIQNKFINMCTGMGLRKSQEPVNINPAWYDDPSYYADVIGQCKVDKYIAKSGKYAGKYRNSIGWFLENTYSQQTAPQQQPLQPSNNVQPYVVQPEPSPFSGDSNEEQIDDLPF